MEKNRGDNQKVQVMNGERPLENNLKKMLRGRIDAVVGSEASIHYIAKKMGILAEIEPAGYGNGPAFIYIAFSPSHSQSVHYAALLSDGIARLRKEGNLETILNQYGLMDWK